MLWLWEESLWDLCGGQGREVLFDVCGHRDQRRAVVVKSRKGRADEMIFIKDEEGSAGLTVYGPNSLCTWLQARRFVQALIFTQGSVSILSFGVQALIRFTRPYSTDLHMHGEGRRRTAL